LRERSIDVSDIKSEKTCDGTGVGTDFGSETVHEAEYTQGRCSIVLLRPIFMPAILETKDIKHELSDAVCSSLLHLIPSDRTYVLASD